MEECAKELCETSQSLKLIRRQRQISQSKRQLEEVKLNIQCHQQDSDTMDVTHSHILEEKLRKVQGLVNHLESLIKHKEIIIARLQQSFVDDFIKVDASHQKYVSEAITMIIPTLTDLPTLLENMERIGQLDSKNLQLADLTADASTVISSQRAVYQQIPKLRSAMSRLYNQRLHDSELT